MWFLCLHIFDVFCVLCSLFLISNTGADAVHTTCYEQKSKVMGLKVRHTIIIVFDCFIFPIHVFQFFSNFIKTTFSLIWTGRECILESYVLRPAPAHVDQTIDISE